MLATCFVILVILPMYSIGHQHLKLVTNTFGLQHQCNHAYAAYAVLLEEFIILEGRKYEFTISGYLYLYRFDNPILTVN